MVYIRVFILDGFDSFSHEIISVGGICMEDTECSLLARKDLFILSYDAFIDA